MDSTLTKASSQQRKPLLERAMFWACLFIALLVLIIAFQNMEPITVQVLFWTLVEVPKVLFLLFVFTLGILTGLLIRLTQRQATRPLDD